MIAALDQTHAAYAALHAACAIDPYGVVRAAYEDYCQVVVAPLVFPDWLTLLAACGMPDVAERQQPSVARPHLRYL
jgi:hypothetical protein